MTAMKSASDTTMEKRFDARRYDLGCYDKHFCLKPPVLLIAMIVFLCRDFLLPLIVAAGSMKGGGDGLFDSVAKIRQQHWFIAGLPALLVFYSLVRRVPKGDVVARWLWRRGRWLLSLSIVLGMYPLLQTLQQRLGNVGDGELPLLLVLLVEIASLSYLWLSRRAGDAFRDFPIAA